MHLRYNKSWKIGAGKKKGRVFIGTADTVSLHGYGCFKPAALMWNGISLVYLSTVKYSSLRFCLNLAAAYLTGWSCAGILSLDVLMHFLEGSIPALMYRDCIASELIYYFLWSGLSVAYACAVRKATGSLSKPTHKKRLLYWATNPCQKLVLIIFKGRAHASSRNRSFQRISSCLSTQSRCASLSICFCIYILFLQLFVRRIVP